MMGALAACAPAPAARCPRPVEAGRIERVSLSGVDEELRVESELAALSGDGNVVAFVAPTLLAHARERGPSQALLRDVEARRTTRLPAPCPTCTVAIERATISANGDFVALEGWLGEGSGSADLAAYLVSVRDGAIQSLNVDDSATPRRVSISRDGSRRAFLLGTRVRVMGPDQRLLPVELADGELPGPGQGPALSADGRWLAVPCVWYDAFHRPARFSVRVFDLGAGSAREIPSGLRADAPFEHVRLTPAGEAIAFSTTAPLVPEDWNSAMDVYVWSLKTGSAQRVSRLAAGGDLDAPSSDPEISASGRYVAFQSYASNLLPFDAPKQARVYLHDVASSRTLLVSQGLGQSLPNGASTDPLLSADGTRVAFRSSASNLVATDANGLPDVFLATIVETAWK